MKWSSLFVFLFLATVANAQFFSNEIPEWFNNPPQSKKYFYGVGKGESRTLEIAEQKALLEAKACIAEQAEPAKVKEVKKISKSKGGKTNEELIQQKVVNAELTGVKVLKKIFIQNGDEYSAYVLIEMRRKK